MIDWKDVWKQSCTCLHFNTADRIRVWLPHLTATAAVYIRIPSEKEMLRNNKNGRKWYFKWNAIRQPRLEKSFLRGWGSHLAPPSQKPIIPHSYLKNCTCWISREEIVHKFSQRGRQGTSQKEHFDVTEATVAASSVLQKLKVSANNTSLK